MTESSAAQSNPEETPQVKPHSAEYLAFICEQLRQKFCNIYAEFNKALTDNFPINPHKYQLARNHFDDGFLRFQEAIVSMEFKATPVAVSKASPETSNLPDVPAPLVPEDAKCES